MTLLGIRNSVYASLDDGGLLFVMENSNAFMSSSLSAILNEQMLYVSGSIDFMLNLTISLPIIGDVRLVDISLGMTATLQIDSNFSLTLNGSFEFWGADLTVPTLTLTTPLADFAAIFDAVVDYIKDNAEDIFAGLFGDLLEWANAVADGIIWFAGSVADVAKEIYELGDDAVGAIIDASEVIGDGAVKIAAGMADAYDWTENSVGVALNAAGYAAEEVAEAFVGAFDTTAEVAAIALNLAGYAVDEVGNALVGVLSVGIDEVGDLLNELNFDDVDEFLDGAGDWAGGAAEDVADEIVGWFVEW